MSSRYSGASDATGDFLHAEKSERAARLTRLWHQRWPGLPPTAPGVRPSPGAYADRRVRFYSLPGAKRYAQTAEERAEIIHRHHVVLGELIGSATNNDLIVIAEDWGPEDLATGWSRQYLPDAWPWLSWHDSEDEEGEHIAYFWVKSGTTVEELDILLQQAADDIARITITDAAMTWLYKPYDGGADVYVSTTAARDDLRTRHVEWLP